MTRTVTTLQPPRSGRLPAVEFLTDDNAKELAAPLPNLLSGLVIWFKTIRLLNEVENEELIPGAPNDGLKQAHKSELAKLIGYGEWLVQRLRANDITAQLGVTLADVEATLEELYDRQRAWYGGMTEKRREKILDEAFGVA